MKKTVKILVLLLVAAMVLPGCAKDPKSMLVGTWKSDLDLSDDFNETVVGTVLDTDYGYGKIDFDYEGKVIMPYEITFGEDGSASVSFSIDAIMDAVDDFLKEFKEPYLEYMYKAVADETGASIEDAEAAVNSTIAAYGGYEKMLNVEALKDSFRDLEYSLSECTYDIDDDGRLVLTSDDGEYSETWTYSIGKNKIEVTAVDSDNELDFNYSLPFTLERDK